MMLTVSMFGAALKGY